MHRATDRFWQRYDRLPKDVQRLADKCFDLLKTNPTHGSLHFKKVRGLWSARVGLAHRALAVEDGSGYLWVWIGSHDEYARIIRSR